VFVADENVESVIVQRLRDDGHDVIWIAESDPGTSDDSVLALAEDEARLLITSDTDFGELVYRQGRARGGSSSAAGAGQARGWPALRSDRAHTAGPRQPARARASRGGVASASSGRELERE
jgi:hypothetical protein